MKTFNVILKALILATVIDPALSATQAAILKEGFTETRLAAGLDSPTAMAFAPDGRLFVCLQGGEVRIIKQDQLLPEPFVSLDVDSNGERGLLGIAFDPDFANNHFVYLNYTTASEPRHNQIVRFTANGDVADLSSETLIFQLDELDAFIHNGGAMHFGADGKLYVAVGENGQTTRAQSLDSLFGKILRINSDGTIPPDNPFFKVTIGNRGAIWALGLRNPFTFAFQPGTARMFINDVGENAWEEIDEGTAGANFGWPQAEGPTANPTFVNPFFYYSHANAPISGCAITGGAFYSPQIVQFPSDYQGKYFFADFCAGWIKSLDLVERRADDFAIGISFPVDLEVGPDGSLYYLARGDTGVITRIQFVQNSAPSISVHPNSQVGSIGESATFNVVATGGAPLAYQWQRDGVDIPGASYANYTIPTAAASDNGVKFRVQVSNTAGSILSQDAVLTVTSNHRPVPTITSPNQDSLYSAGDAIHFAGQAQDAEDGALAGSAFKWKVDFQHDTHAHPFMPDTSGIAEGTFGIPTSGEVSSNVWYRIYLTVTDSGGLSQTTFRDIFPRKANISLATNPAGLQVALDGQPRSTPFSVMGVVGMKRQLSVVSPQTVNGVTYEFQSWSDEGATSHEISTPDSDVTYTTNFAALPDQSTIQFDQPTYNVSENEGSIKLTVTRSGDLSTAATVDYSTVNDTASDRSDYTTCVGQFRFSAGESEKSLTVLITDDLLVQGDRRFLVRLSNSSGGPVLGATDTATVTIQDDELAPRAANWIDDERNFVWQHYDDFLNREPDADGLEFWTKQITDCGSDVRCREIKRIEVSAAFFFSIEFQKTGFLVYLLDQAGLGRFPEYHEFIRDSQELSRGVVVLTPGWEDQLASNQRDFVETFVQRIEFKAHYPDGLSPVDYVTLLNQNNGNPLSDLERNFLSSELNAGRLTRGQVLQQVAQSWEFTRREMNRAFVLMQYFGYLRRNPNDAPDDSWAGYDFWLAKLNDFKGDYIKAEMIKAFISSLEYRARFGPS